ncbi:MAG: T9SS type A sorting domain-containing protein, partial [Bacteroidota bacterium]
NTFYFYNGSPIDSDCGVEGYGDNPPVLAQTYLNATLTNYHFYNSDFSITGNPETASDFYDYMNGVYKDGVTPVEYGGSGINQGTFPYPWFFPTNPNDLTPGGWSEVLVGNSPADRRGVGGTGPYSFLPGETIEIDQAFSFFQDPDLNNLETVNLLYQELPLLQEAYNNNFSDNQPIPFCTTDCVWPGDINRDGIVDMIDVLRLAGVEGTTGPDRFPVTTAWFPYNAPAWDPGFVYTDGINLVNADCNGNGITNGAEDLEAIKLNYGLTNNLYTGDSGEDIPGTELFVEKTIFDPPLDAIVPGTFNQFDIWVALPPQEQGQVAGLAFDLQVEATDFTPQAIISNLLQPIFNVLHTRSEGEGLLEYGGASSTGNALPVSANLRLARFRVLVPVDIPDCEVRMTFSNVKAVRTDGTYFTLENADSVWPIQGCVVVNTEEPNLTGVAVELMPNPSSDQVFIQADDLQIQQIEVFDINGRQIAVPLSWDTYPVLTVKHLPEGVYLIRLQTDQGEVTKRLVVQR